MPSSRDHNGDRFDRRITGSNAVSSPVKHRERHRGHLKNDFLCPDHHFFIKWVSAGAENPRFRGKTGWFSGG